MHKPPCNISCIHWLFMQLQHIHHARWQQHTLKPWFLSNQCAHISRWHRRRSLCYRRRCSNNQLRSAQSKRRDNNKLLALFFRIFTNGKRLRHQHYRWRLLKNKHGHSSCNQAACERKAQNANPIDPDNKTHTTHQLRPPMLKEQHATLPHRIHRYSSKKNSDRIAQYLHTEHLISWDDLLLDDWAILLDAVAAISLEFTSSA